MINKGNDRLWRTFSSLTAIDSPSFGERQMCGALKAELEELGVSCYEDGAGGKIGGDSGNLHGFLPGEGDPVLLSAHMDTVEPSRGKKAVRNGSIVTSAGGTVLGADDAAGIAAILETLRRLKESGAPHRPIELLFPVAEEVFGVGSAAADYGRVKAKEAYTLDLGGAIGEAANAAPTIISFTMNICGKAAHAGFAPKDGVHSIAAAANAIARMALGEVKPGLSRNIGTICGGNAKNIIPENCRVTGEIRGLSHGAALALWEETKAIFAEETDALGASLEITNDAGISAYEVPLSSPVARNFENACRAIGVPCRIHSTMGGSDNNNFALHGIEGLVIACSMRDVHSVRESCDLDELGACVELLLHLVSGADK